MPDTQTAKSDPIHYNGAYNNYYLFAVSFLPQIAVYDDNKAYQW